jgi:hypothetical protein
MFGRDFPPRGMWHHLRLLRRESGALALRSPSQKLCAKKESYFLGLGVLIDLELTTDESKKEKTALVGESTEKDGTHGLTPPDECVLGGNEYKSSLTSKL